jgi:hypothetical protein
MKTTTSLARDSDAFEPLVGSVADSTEKLLG